MILTNLVFFCETGDFCEIFDSGDSGDSEDSEDSG